LEPASCTELAVLQAAWQVAACKQTEVEWESPGAGGYSPEQVAEEVAAVVACRYHCSLVVEQRLRPVGPE